MIKSGTIEKIAQAMKWEFEKSIDPLEMLATLSKHICVVEEQDVARKNSFIKQEIILSVYQQGNN